MRGPRGSAGWPACRPGTRSARARWSRGPSRGRLPHCAALESIEASVALPRMSRASTPTTTPASDHHRDGGAERETRRHCGVGPRAPPHPQRAGLGHRARPHPRQRQWRPSPARADRRPGRSAGPRRERAGGGRESASWGVRGVNDRRKVSHDRRLEKHATMNLLRSPTPAHPAQKPPVHDEPRATHRDGRPHHRLVRARAGPRQRLGAPRAALR